VNVKLLPGGEIFPALERGVIDAAEFVGPYQDRRMGLHKAAKYYYTTGWHEPSNVTELMINKKAWETLPADLQAIVTSCAQACDLDSHAWSEANNADALADLVQNEGVIAQTLPDDVVMALKKLTAEVLAEKAAADPLTKKVHDHFMAFRDKHRSWAAVSEKPYHGLISS
jgi:TRAP-type mannitol/chloroaromatic compound transport system substrate-binding protein